MHQKCFARGSTRGIGQALRAHGAKLFFGPGDDSGSARGCPGAGSGEAATAVGAQSGRTVPPLAPVTGPSSFSPVGRPGSTKKPGEIRRGKPDRAAISLQSG